jgi:uncharacterized protein (TIGR02001 family)
MIKTFVAGLLASTALSSVALAGGSVKDAPAPAGRQLSWSFNIGGTSDYVFRGVSQNAQDPALQGGVDLTYGIFYAGVWSSMVGFGPTLAGNDDVVTAEVDLYAGIKPVWGPLTFDLGVIYYAYPGANDSNVVTTGWLEQNYVELKAGVSGSPFKNMTLGGTVFYSPEYNNESGNTWTLEGTAGYELPKIGPFTPTINGTLGTTLFENATLATRWNTSLGDDSYLYWNAGVALAVDKLTFDFRYWDTDISGGTTSCNNTVALRCDERFVFSAKITLP